MHLVFHSGLHCIFIEQSLCVKHYGRYRDKVKLKEDKKPALAEFTFHARETIENVKQSKTNQLVVRDRKEIERIVTYRTSWWVKG